MRRCARALCTAAVAGFVVIGVTTTASARPKPPPSAPRDAKPSGPEQAGVRVGEPEPQTGVPPTPTTAPDDVTNGESGRDDDAKLPAWAAELPAIVAKGASESRGSPTGRVESATTRQAASQKATAPSSSSSLFSDNGQRAAAPGDPPPADHTGAGGLSLRAAPRGSGVMAEVLSSMLRRPAGADPPPGDSCLVAAGMGSTIPDVCSANGKAPTRLEPIVRGTEASNGSDPPSGGGGGGALPLSGVDTVPTVALATALLGAGALVLGVRRRVAPGARVSISGAFDDWHVIDELDGRDRFDRTRRSATKITVAESHTDGARVLRAASDAMGIAPVAQLAGVSTRTLQRLRAGDAVRPTTIERAVAGLAESFPHASNPLEALVEHAGAARRCRACGQRLTGRQRAWCSSRCRTVRARKVPRRMTS